MKFKLNNDLPGLGIITLLPCHPERSEGSHAVRLLSYNNIPNEVRHLFRLNEFSENVIVTPNAVRDPMP